MKKFNNILSLAALLLSLTGCKDRIQPERGDVSDGGKQMVLFSAGSENQISTRAATVSYMPDGVRFSSMMLIKESEGAEYKYELPFNAYMLVDSKGVGNSLYYKSTYEVPLKLDVYENDDDASVFYWQNRLKHAFIGYVDDYNTPNSLGTDLAGWRNDAPCNADGTRDKTLSEKFIYTMKKDGTILSWQQYEEFDLRRGTLSSMGEQKDPLVACVEKVPEGSSAEKNRVYLTFRHQFSQVQVNIKGSSDIADITSDQIDMVELLGVAETAYVFPYPGYAHDEVNDTWSLMRYGDDDELIRPVEHVAITLDQLNANPPSGTAFEMFEMDSERVATGYLKGFEAIAFGNLDNLRITWHESEEGHTEHVVTFKVTNPRFNKLESGKRYIFNLELRRGTLAVIKADIVDWIPYETVYDATGTVKR